MIREKAHRFPLSCTFQGTSGGNPTTLLHDADQRRYAFDQHKIIRSGGPRSAFHNSKTRQKPMDRPRKTCLTRKLDHANPKADLPDVFGRLSLFAPASPRLRPNSCSPSAGPAERSPNRGSHPPRGTEGAHRHQRCGRGEESMVDEGLEPMAMLLGRCVSWTGCVSW